MNGVGKNWKSWKMALIDSVVFVGGTAEDAIGVACAFVVAVVLAR
jgi:hypothetical protein